MSKVSWQNWLAVSLAALAAAAAATSLDEVAVGHFSAARAGGELPAGWRKYAFGNIERHTEFSLVELDGKTVLKADARASAAALIYPLQADPKRTPWLEWRWRADGVVSAADIRTKQGDDYAARIYVLFDYDSSRLPLGQRARIALARLVYGQELPLAALCYVFDNRQPVGFSAWSAYTERLRMIVAASGNGDTMHWLTVKRNVAEDFRAAFGEDPPTIKAIVVASDTDNTGETVRAYFGDITLRHGVSERQ